MLTNSAGARDTAHVLHGFVNLKTQLERAPTVMASGKGIYVMDENGTPFMEGAAGMWCTSLGFGDQELIDAAVEQLHKLPYYHTVAYKSVNPAIDLAERLAGLVPIEKAHIHFALSGSEANDFLVKFIRFYNNARGRPRKKKIVSRVNGYHGATVMAASLTGIPANHRLFDLPLPGIVHVSDPNYFRNGLDGESREEFAERLVRELEDTIIREDPETIAAFIAEPISGAGGVSIPPQSYYAGVRAVLDKYDILFLDDEVINGFYRTGKLWGSQTMDFKPDTMTLAKGLTSGYQPLGAVVVSDEIFQGLVEGSAATGYFGHGTTYSGHPVGCAVALKLLDILETRNIGAHVERVSKRFAARLRGLSDHPYVGEARGVGLIGAVEFVSDKRTKAPFLPAGSFAAKVKERAEETHKLIVRALSGCDGCAFSPPLIITEEEVDEMFDRFTRALDEVATVFERDGR